MLINLIKFQVSCYNNNGINYEYDNSANGIVCLSTYRLFKAKNHFIAPAEEIIQSLYDQHMTVSPLQFGKIQLKNIVHGEA